MTKRTKRSEWLDAREDARLCANREKAPIAGGAADLAFELSRNLDPESPWTAIWSRLQDRYDRGVELTNEEAEEFGREARYAIRLGRP